MGGRVGADLIHFGEQGQHLLIPLCQQVFPTLFRHRIQCRKGVRMLVNHLLSLLCGWSTQLIVQMLSFLLREAFQVAGQQSCVALKAGGNLRGEAFLHRCAEMLRHFVRPIPLGGDLRVGLIKCRLHLSFSGISRGIHLGGTFFIVEHGAAELLDVHRGS